MIMDEFSRAINIAVDKFKEVYGDNIKLSDGDTVVFSGNNFTLIISVENGELKTNFLADEVIKIDYKLEFFE